MRSSTRPNVVQTASEPVPSLRGEVCFEHLYFRYNDKEQVLSDFSLCVQPGETLALSDTPGRQSSVAKLIARSMSSSRAG